MDDARLSIVVRGRVQGVGFRYWVRSRASALGLRGWAENLVDGRVEVAAEGPRAACQALLDALDSEQPPGYVTGMRHSWEQPRGEPDGFRVR
jgi:acylphosphatase